MSRGATEELLRASETGLLSFSAWGGAVSGSARFDTTRQAARMAVLVQPRPDWRGALQGRLARPPGVPERRSGEESRTADADRRPRRISDDSAWFRDAVDEPVANGLRRIDDVAGLAAWESVESPLVSRLVRLRDRGVLDAAGFLLPDADPDLDGS